jgi:predicted RNase H-like HicB family nuclease
MKKQKPFLKIEIGELVMETIVKAYITLADGYYLGECYNLPVVTQGHTLDEVVKNLREAISLALEDDFQELGFDTDNPPIIVTLELPKAHAA